MELDTRTKKVSLMTYAVRGLIATAEDSTPAEGWPDALIPVFDLGIEIEQGLRALNTKELGQW